MDGLLCGPDPLCSLESKAAAAEGASHDLVDYLRWPELHSHGSSGNCPCRVPGHQPVPRSREDAEHLSLAVGFKACQTFPYSFRKFFKKYINFAKNLLETKLLIRVESQTVSPTLPFMVPQTEEHPGAKLCL